jgi:hypothetical protein
VLVVAGKKEGGENHRKKELSLILQGKRNSTDGREREGRRGWSRVEPTVASGEVAAEELSGQPWRSREGTPGRDYDGGQR